MPNASKCTANEKWESLRERVKPGLQSQGGLKSYQEITTVPLSIPLGQP